MPSSPTSTADFATNFSPDSELEAESSPDSPADSPELTSPDTAALIDEVDQHFAQRFGDAPEFYAIAPGRINLIGEHTDYTGGMVLPIAIDRRLVIAARRIPGPTAHLRTTLNDDLVEIDIKHQVPPAIGHWATYFLGVLAGFQRKNTEIPAFEALIHSHIPTEAGLSSSAAYEVAATTLLQALTGKVLEPLESILIAQKSEQEYAGVPCGIMDQFVCTVAREDHALLLDCDQLEARHIHLADRSAEILIFDTGVSNLEFRKDYRERRASTEEAASIVGVKRLSRATPEWISLREVDLGPRLLRRAQHVLSENRRVLEASRQIEAGDWPALGAILNEGQRSLEEDFEISHPRTRQLIALRHQIPSRESVYGARVTGMGFGGSVIYLVKADHAQQIVQEVQQAYENATGYRPRAIVTRPSQGVELFGNTSQLQENPEPSPTPGE